MLDRALGKTHGQQFMTFDHNYMRSIVVTAEIQAFFVHNHILAFLREAAKQFPEEDLSSLKQAGDSRPVFKKDEKVGPKAQTEVML
ncbi:hypothetical protein AK812_SmicGene47817, partial [Symbiodinium microadriaticum]